MKLPFGLRAANIQAKITFVMYWFMLGNETYYLHLHQGQWFVLPKGSPQKIQDIFAVHIYSYECLQVKTWVDFCIVLKKITGLLKMCIDSLPAGGAFRMAEI